MRAILLFVALTGTALAQDAAYPLTGYLGSTDVFTGPAPDAAPADLLARCALAFVDQKENGDFTTYLVDRAAFAGGKLTYHPVMHGHCEPSPTTGAEVCSAYEQAASLTDERTFFDAWGKVGPDSMEVILFDTLGDAERRQNSPGSFVFHRCPFNNAVVEAAITDTLVTWEEDEINELRFPSAEILASPTTQAIGNEISP